MRIELEKRLEEERKNKAAKEAEELLQEIAEDNFIDTQRAARIRESQYVTSPKMSNNDDCNYECMSCKFISSCLLGFFLYNDEINERLLEHLKDNT
jgi:rubrerythrin